MHPGLQIVRVKKEEFCYGKYRKAAEEAGHTHKCTLIHTHSHLAVFISSEACCVNYMVPERELEYTQHF